MAKDPLFDRENVFCQLSWVWGVGVRLIAIVMEMNELMMNMRCAGILV